MRLPPVRPQKVDDQTGFEANLLIEQKFDFVV